jgi:SAM-dependent methyltransferase
MLQKEALRCFSGERSKARVVIPGCGACGEDVQLWLRRGFGQIAGVDLNDFSETWEYAIPILESTYGAKVRCEIAAMEELPYEESSADLLYTAATLEHVYNLELAVAESHRVLKPGGLAVHAIGPLYYTHGGDHCISAYGLEHGYDHLLMDQASYAVQINDDAFFRTTWDPNQHWWAKNNQLSFLHPRDYLDTFEKVFQKRCYVGVEISSEGVAFREQFPEKWNQLIESGVSEESLLVKSLMIVYQK